MRTSFLFCGILYHFWKYFNRDHAKKFKISPFLLEKNLPANHFTAQNESGSLLLGKFAVFLKKF